MKPITKKDAKELLKHFVFAYTPGKEFTVNDANTSKEKTLSNWLECGFIVKDAEKELSK